MSSEKSFADILNEKLNEKLAGPHKRPQPSAVPRDVKAWDTIPPLPPMDWPLTDLHLKFSTPLSHVKNYTGTARRTEAETPPLSQPRSPSAAAPTPAPEPVANWSFEQQLALQKLIELGAPLHLKSSAAEIKKSYRQLLIKYHPDHNSQSSELHRKRLERCLQGVIEAYRDFLKPPTATAA